MNDKSAHGAPERKDRAKNPPRGRKQLTGA
jgi:hypothetical protein